MPTYVRWREKGATYFFTVVTHRRRPIFKDEKARALLSRVIKATRERYPFKTFALVLLPDHLHCIWEMPNDDDNFPTRWRQIKASFTRQYLLSGGRSLTVSSQRAAKRFKGVWQPRYWEHQIRDEDDLYQHRDYIHLNPVKHGYVERPEDWPWSSFHRHVAEGWLDPHWPGNEAVPLPEVAGEVT